MALKCDPLYCCQMSNSGQLSLPYRINVFTISTECVSTMTAHAIYIYIYTHTHAHTHTYIYTSPVLYKSSCYASYKATYIAPVLSTLSCYVSDNAAYITPVQITLSCYASYNTTYIVCIIYIIISCILQCQIYIEHVASTWSKYIYIYIYMAPARSTLSCNNVIMITHVVSTL